MTFATKNLPLHLRLRPLLSLRKYHKTSFCPVGYFKYDRANS